MSRTQPSLNLQYKITKYMRKKLLRSESVKQQMAKLDLQDLRYWNGQIQNIKKKKKKELFKLEK